MKKILTGVNLLVLTSAVAAHTEHSEGYHSQQQGVLQQVDPVLVGALALMVIGILSLGVSYQKYRETS